MTNSIKDLKTFVKELISIGENQEIEFKAQLTHVKSLGKEIAAFATSNSGTILLGVEDNGTVIGLDNAITDSERKRYIKTVEGICSGTVKPGITTSIYFLEIEKKDILVISVPKGNDPIYYVDHKPFIRRHTESRPADPNDVINHIKKYLDSDLVDEQQHEKNQFFSDLLKIINKTSLIIDQSDKRVVNPWHEQWKSDCNYIAKDFRTLASNQFAIELSMSDELIELSNHAESIDHLQSTLSNGPSLDELVRQLETSKNDFKQKYLSEIALDKSSIDSIFKSLKQSFNSLKILYNRVDDLVNDFKTEEMQDEATEIGGDILNVAYYEIDSQLNGNQSELIKVGIKLNLLETFRVYSDGGESVRKIGEEIKECFDSLKTILIDSSII